MITATRYHDFSCGHRVVGHEGKCALLHGHNYRVHFTLEPTRAEHSLDRVGRVIDFSIIKSRLCEWLETHWDHRFLAWTKDSALCALDKHPIIADSIVWLPVNPTAENLAAYLVDEIGPYVLEGTHARLVHVVVEETRKCSAAASSEFAQQLAFPFQKNI